MRTIYAERGQSATPERHTGQAVYTAGDVARAYSQGETEGWQEGFKAGKEAGRALALHPARWPGMLGTDETWIDPDYITD